MRALQPLALMAASLALSGCVASTLANVVTAPVRVGAKAVDLATTSQSEADERRGRELRRKEERLGELQRDYEKARAKCDDGEQKYCDRLPGMWEEMEQLRRELPAPPPER